MANGSSNGIRTHIERLMKPVPYLSSHATIKSDREVIAAFLSGIKDAAPYIFLRNVKVSRFPLYERMLLPDHTSV